MEKGASDSKPQESAPAKSSHSSHHKRSRSRSDSRSRIYIGHISTHARESDLREVFEKYGSIRNVEVKFNYAFLEYDDSKSAKQAIDKLNGQDLDGHRMIVEMAEPRKRGNGPSSKDVCFNCGHSGHW